MSNNKIPESTLVRVEVYSDKFTIIDTFETPLEGSKDEYYFVTENDKGTIDVKNISNLSDDEKKLFSEKYNVDSNSVKFKNDNVIIPENAISNNVLSGIANIFKKSNKITPETDAINNISSNGNMNTSKVSPEGQPPNENKGFFQKLFNKKSVKVAPEGSGGSSRRRTPSATPSRAAR